MRLEMGQEQNMNDPNKVFEPIFYKGTTFSNYKEACHVLSCNNCSWEKETLTQQWQTNSTKKLKLQILTMNQMKKVYLAMLQINCILIVPMPSMMFFHHFKITMIYQCFRIILWPKSVLWQNLSTMILKRIVPQEFVTTMRNHYGHCWEDVSQDAKRMTLDR